MEEGLEVPDLEGEGFVAAFEGVDAGEEGGDQLVDITFGAPVHIIN